MIPEEIQKIARDENIPVFGIGPASVMADEPPGFICSKCVSLCPYGDKNGCPV